MMLIDFFIKRNTTINKKKLKWVSDNKSNVQYIPTELLGIVYGEVFRCNSNHSSQPDKMSRIV